MRSMFLRYWKPVLAVVVFLAMGRAIVKVMLAPPANMARASDVEKAKREAAPPEGASDVRRPAGPSIFVAGNGRVEPRGEEIPVASPVAGVVARVGVKEGDRVTKGDLLVQLEASVETAAVASAEADLGSARAALAKARVGSRHEDKEAAASEAAAAAARAALAKSVADRSRGLASTGTITAEENDRAQRQAEDAAASARAAKARAEAAERGSRVEDILQLEAQAAAAAARVSQAKAVLERLSVRAPSDAQVLAVNVVVGAFAQPAGGAVVVLGDTTGLRVRMEVDERDIERVALGAPAFVTADAFGDRRFTARVVELGRRMGRKKIESPDPAERKDTQVLEVLLDLEGTPAQLVSGLRVTAYVEPKR
ncbi:MAG: hypothetical protein RL199_814 [Pseudomonadota bacterium]|jgi:HlyD family secretion protein